MEGGKGVLLSDQSFYVPGIVPELIKYGSTGSMLQEHVMILGTYESDTHTNKQPIELQ